MILLLVIQSCPTVCDSVDCSLPGSSIHELLQARKQEWVAITFSRGSYHSGIKPSSPALQADSLPSDPQVKPLRWRPQFLKNSSKIYIRLLKDSVLGLNYYFLSAFPLFLPSFFVVVVPAVFFPLVVAVQSLSPVPFFVTPWTAACQASLFFTLSQSLLKPLSIESVMPSNHLILCHRLLLPSVFPSIRIFSTELTLCIRWPKYWSFSFGIRPFSEYSGLICFRIDWFHLLAVQRTLKFRGLSTVQKHH